MPDVGHANVCSSCSLAHILEAARTDTLQSCVDKLQEDMDKLFGLYQGHYERLVGIHGELIKMYQAVMLKRIIVGTAQVAEDKGGVIMERQNGSA